MFQKYGSDKIENLLIDKVECAAVEYMRANEELVQYQRRKSSAEILKTLRGEKDPLPAVS